MSKDLSEAKYDHKFRRYHRLSCGQQHLMAEAPEPLLALLLESLLRSAEREVTFLRVLPSGAKPDEIRRANRDLLRLADDLADDAIRNACRVEVVCSDEPLATVVDLAEDFDLIILGVQRLGRRKKLFGHFARQIANRSACPIIAISRRS